MALAMGDRSVFCGLVRRGYQRGCLRRSYSAGSRDEIDRGNAWIELDNAPEDFADRCFRQLGSCLDQGYQAGQMRIVLCCPLGDQPVDRLPRRKEFVRCPLIFDPHRQAGKEPDQAKPDEQ
jgi:hypothetical protein